MAAGPSSRRFERITLEHDADGRWRGERRGCECTWGTIGTGASGVALGVVSAYALASMVASLLFGVTASDPVTYLGVVALTLIAAIAATWLPMRRAATIDPLESLRHS